MYEEAAALYRSCLTGVHEQDPDIRYGLATALLSNGAFDEALAVAQRLRSTHPSFRAPDVGLVYARALEGRERFEEAQAEFKILADTYPGEEGRWRYGALLMRLGRDQDAQEVFKRMLRNAERLPSHYRDAQREWLTLARQNVRT